MRVKPVGMLLMMLAGWINRHQQDVIARIRVSLVQEPELPPLMQMRLGLLNQERDISVRFSCFPFYDISQHCGHENEVVVAQAILPTSNFLDAAASRSAMIVCVLSAMLGLVVSARNLAFTSSSSPSGFLTGIVPLDECVASPEVTSLYARYALSTRYRDFEKMVKLGLIRTSSKEGVKYIEPNYQLLERLEYNV